MLASSTSFSFSASVSRWILSLRCWMSVRARLKGFSTSTRSFLSFSAASNARVDTAITSRSSAEFRFALAMMACRRACIASCPSAELSMNAIKLWTRSSPGIAGTVERCVGCGVYCWNDWVTWRRRSCSTSTCSYSSLGRSILELERLAYEGGYCSLVCTRTCGSSPRKPGTLPSLLSVRRYQPSWSPRCLRNCAVLGNVTCPMKMVASPSRPYTDTTRSFMSCVRSNVNLALKSGLTDEFTPCSDRATTGVRSCSEPYVTSA
mmetsp:Transcript_441/g.907  ORF Transcript_441/g.907 Transcript_441/m.907 type:complete len:263 (+) Transcript_441:1165-1953(+)